MQLSFLQRAWAQRMVLCSILLAFFTSPAWGGGLAITPPEWLRNGAMYELFPRDFSPSGDFKGVTSRLDELQRLGVNIIWLMPIHPIGKEMRKGTLGSPYAVRDYYAINPDYGTADDLKRLIAEAHRRGMKVIMDLVANHTAWDCVLMDHPDFYKHDAAGHIIPPNPDWKDVAALNYANPAVRQYMIGVMKHWIDPQGFDFDGFRCDAAAEVPISFWEEARAELLKIKPDIMMLAEASDPQLMIKAFDIGYSWPLLTSLNNVLLHGAPAAELTRTWEKTRSEFPDGALQLRISDDHDEPRAVARFGLRGALAASAMMFTLDGVPLLYNGMEVGDATESGAPALFEKEPVFWQPKDRPDLRAIYRSLIALRMKSPAFRNNVVTWLRNSDANDVVSYLRSDAKDEFAVVINFSNRPENVSVQGEHLEDFTAAPIDGMPAPDGQRLPALRLGGFDWRIFHRDAAPITSASLGR